MMDIDPRTARRIIQQLGGPGQPPEYGVQFFSVGLEPYLDVINEEYLSTFIKYGGSAFKLVVGIYGGGKTHFLYCVRDLAWSKDFAVSYVSLRSSGESPFHQLDLVYRAIVGGLIPPISDPDINPEEVRGIENFLRYWYRQSVNDLKSQGLTSLVARDTVLDKIGQISLESVQSFSFRNAIVQALRAIETDDERLYSEICQWIKGEAPPSPKLRQHNITQKVDRTTAFSLIRSLGQIVRLLGYSGLLVLLDEAERVTSLSTRQREQLLSNLREFIDECGQSTFQGMMVFYAVPDKNFLEGRTQVYEALRQRLATEFDFINPTGVSIELDEAVDDPEEFLRLVGRKIVPIYNATYGVVLSEDVTSATIDRLAEKVARERFADAGYKRLFVQRLVSELNKLYRADPKPGS